MILDTFTYFRLFHCDVNNHNKVWGYFLHGAHWWAFWGGVGKSCTFKYHGVDEIGTRSTLTDLASSKMRKGYSETVLSAWHVWDPDWQDMFNERFIYFLLQQPAI
jgi:predicted DNA-binding WGR domain protein